MKIKVLFFATLKDRAGVPTVQLEVNEPCTVKQLRRVLITVYPKLDVVIDTALVSINRQYALDDEWVPEGAEIGFFPPVSGGSGVPTICQITEDVLDLNALLAQVTSPESGAACIFSGIVRGITTRGLPHETINLEYEAYVPMAEEKMQQVAAEIRSRWPEVQGIMLVQRIGRLAPMTTTVLIICTAAHRDTGVFDAARYGIDRLKEIVPIWKKEISQEGAEWVEGKYHPVKGE